MGKDNPKSFTAVLTSITGAFGSTVTRAPAPARPLNLSATSLFSLADKYPGKVRTPSIKSTNSGIEGSMPSVNIAVLFLPNPEKSCDGGLYLKS